MIETVTPLLTVGVAVGFPTHEAGHPPRLLFLTVRTPLYLLADADGGSPNVD
jgi:hypothetical protein